MIRCTVTGCNYPEAECSGACSVHQARHCLHAAHQAERDAAHEMRRVDDSLRVAGWCALGVAAMCGAGLLVTVLGALARWLP